MVKLLGTISLLIFTKFVELNPQSQIKQKINCTIAGLEELQQENKNDLEQCKLRPNAKAAYKVFKEVADDFLAYPHRFGCPFPCIKLSYKVSLKYFHETAWPDIYKPANFSNKFFLSLFFDTFDMVENEETLVYDAGNFFAAAGGHLGLFLGFSCLSLLMQIIDYLNLHFNKT